MHVHLFKVTLDERFNALINSFCFRRAKSAYLLYEFELVEHKLNSLIIFVLKQEQAEANRDGMWVLKEMVWFIDWTKSKT